MTHSAADIREALQDASDNSWTVTTKDGWRWHCEHEPTTTTVGRLNAERIGETFMLYGLAPAPSEATNARCVFTSQCTPSDVEYAIVSLFVEQYESRIPEGQAVIQRQAEEA